MIGVESAGSVWSLIKEMCIHPVGAFILGAVLFGAVCGVIPYRMYEMSECKRVEADSIVVKKDRRIEALTAKLLTADYDCLEKMRTIQRMFSDMKEDTERTRQTVSDVHRRANDVLTTQEEVLTEVKRIATPPCE